MKKKKEMQYSLRTSRIMTTFHYISEPSVRTSLSDRYIMGIKKKYSKRTNSEKAESDTQSECKVVLYDNEALRSKKSPLQMQIGIDSALVIVTKSLFASENYQSY